MTNSFQSRHRWFLLTLSLALLTSGCKPPPTPPKPTPIEVTPKPVADEATPPSSDETQPPDISASTLPFSVELQAPFTFDGVPALHSYAYAQADVEGTKILLVTGRKSGLHGFEAPTPANPADSFPRQDANDRIWVIDPQNQKVWSLEISALATMDPPLPATIDTYQWQSSNALTCQLGDKLYIVGGYGFSPKAQTTGKNITFGALTVMNVTDVIKAVMAQQSIAPYVSQVADPRLKVTGGDLLPYFGSLPMDSAAADSTTDTAAPAPSQQFCAVFGQSFDGLYSVSVAGTGTLFRQTYTEQFRVFSVNAPANATESLSISNYNAYPTTFLGSLTPLEFDGYPWAEYIQVRPYHRRDLNVVAALSPTGQRRIGVYGGVFRPGRFDAYLEPIYIDQVISQNYTREGVPNSYQSFTPGVDHKFQQLLNHYKCASLPVYDPASGQMTTVFFGGISNYRYDAATNQLIKDPIKRAPSGRPIVDGVPFDRTVSSLVVRKDSTSAGYVLPISMPGFLGTEAELLIDPSIPQDENGVIRLDKLTGPTKIGYIYGGIQAFGPYTGEYEQNADKPGPSSVAYNQFIPVVITPGNWKVAAMPPKPAEAP